MLFGSGFIFGEEKSSSTTMEFLMKEEFHSVRINGRGKQQCEKSSEEIKINDEELSSALEMKEVTATGSRNKTIIALPGASRPSQRLSEDNSLLINFPFPQRISAPSWF